MARELILESYRRCRAVCLRHQAALAGRFGLGPHAGETAAGNQAPAGFALDLALYGYGPDGVALIRRYIEDVSGGLPDPENEVLDAMANAMFSLFRVTGRDECAGVRALDLLSGETLWIVDDELERTAARGAELAQRVFRIHEFWMTTGAPVALTEEVWRELEGMGVARPRTGGGASCGPAGPPAWLDRDILAQAVLCLTA